jgi:hypothetical protein
VGVRDEAHDFQLYLFTRSTHAPISDSPPVITSPRI